MCHYKEYLYCLCHHHVRRITPCREMRWKRAAMELKHSSYRMARAIPARIIAGVRRPWPQFLHSQAPKIPDLEIGLAVQGPTVEKASQAQQELEAKRAQEAQRGLDDVPDAIRGMDFITQAPPARDFKQIQAIQGPQHVPQEVPAPQVPEHEVPDAIHLMGFARQAPPARALSARQAAEGQADGGDVASQQVTDAIEAQEDLRRINVVAAPPVPSTSDLESTSQASGEGDAAGIASHPQNVIRRISQLPVPSNSDLGRYTHSQTEGHGEAETQANGASFATHPEAVEGHGEAETGGNGLPLATALEIIQILEPQRSLLFFIHLWDIRIQRKAGRIMAPVDLQKELVKGRRMAAAEAARRKKEEEYEPEVLVPQREEDGAPMPRVMPRTKLDLKNHPPPPKPEFMYNADKPAESAAAGDDINDELPPGPFCPPPKKFRTENHADLCPECVKIYEKAKIPHHWANHYVVEYKRNVVYYDVTKLQHLPDGSRWGCVEVSGYTPPEIKKMEKVYTGEWDQDWKPIKHDDSDVYWMIVPKKKKKPEKKEKTVKERELARKAMNRTPWRLDLEKGGFTLSLEQPYQDFELQGLSEIEAKKAKEEAAKKKEKAAIDNIRNIGVEDMETMRKELKELDRKLREARWIEANKVRMGTQGEAVNEAQWKLAFERSELEEMLKKDNTRQRKNSEAQTQREAAVFAAYDPIVREISDFNVQGRFDNPRQRLRGLTQSGPRAVPKRSNILDDAQENYSQLTRPQRAYTTAAPQYNPLVAGPRGLPAPDRIRTTTVTPKYEALHRARKNTVPARPSNLRTVERAETPNIDPAPVDYGVGNGNPRTLTPYRDEHGYYSVDGTYIPYSPPNLSRPHVNTTPTPACPAEAFYKTPEADGGDIVLASLNSLPHTQFDQPRPQINRNPISPAATARAVALQAAKAAYEERCQEERSANLYTQYDEPRSQVNLPRTPAPGRPAQAVHQTPKPAYFSSDTGEFSHTPHVLSHGPARANTTIDYPKTPRLAVGKGVSKKSSKQKLKAEKQHKKVDAYGDDYEDQATFDESNLFVIGENSEGEGSDKENKGKWRDVNVEGIQLRKLMGRKKPERVAMGSTEGAKTKKKVHGFRAWKKVLVEDEVAKEERMSYIAPQPLQLPTMPEAPKQAFTKDESAPEPQRTESYTFTHGLMTAASDLDAARNAITRPSAAATSFDNYEERFARRMAMLQPPPAIIASPEQIRRSPSPQPIMDEVMMDPVYFGDIDASAPAQAPMRHAPPPHITADTTRDEYDLEFDPYGAGPSSCTLAFPAAPRRPRPATLVVSARQNTEWPSSAGLGSGKRTPGERRRGLWDEEEEGVEGSSSLEEGETEDGGKWAAC